MITWRKVSDDYEREVTLMITDHYSIGEWGLILHYVINSLIFPLLKNPNLFVQIFSILFTFSPNVSFFSDF